MIETVQQWRRPHRGLRDTMKGVLAAAACAAFAGSVVYAARGWPAGGMGSGVDAAMLLGLPALAGVLALVTVLFYLELDQGVVIDRGSRVIRVHRPFTTSGPLLGFPRRMEIPFASVASCTYRGEIHRRRNHPPLEEMILEVRGVRAICVRLRCLNGSGLAEVVENVRAATGAESSGERLRQDRTVEIWIAAAILAVTSAGIFLAIRLIR